MPDRALVIIPTYNERENLPQIVPAVLLQDQRLEILVVDDNSPDGTGQLAGRSRGTRTAGARAAPDVEGWPGPGVHRGVPVGARAGIRLHLRDGRRLLARPQVPSRLPGRIQNADLVLGSRYKQGVNVINWPISRLLLSLGANVYARWITGLPLSDSTGGFKCFRRQVLEAIDLEAVRSNGYAFQIEMSFRAWRKGFRLVELPIVFTDRVEGSSKMSKRIVREAIWMVWWLRVQGMLGKI